MTNLTGIGYCDITLQTLQYIITPKSEKKAKIKKIDKMIKNQHQARLTYTAYQ